MSIALAILAVVAAALISAFMGGMVYADRKRVVAETERPYLWIGA